MNAITFCAVIGLKNSADIFNVAKNKTKKFDSYSTKTSSEVLTSTA